MTAPLALLQAPADAWARLDAALDAAADALQPGAPAAVLDAALGELLAAIAGARPYAPAEAENGGVR